MRVLGLLALGLLAQLIEPTDAKINHLKLKKERRHYFVVSSFGLLQGGTITVRIGKYKAFGKIAAAGFSIHQSNQKATEYNLNMIQSDQCFLTDPTVGNDFVKLAFNGTSRGLVSNHHILGGVDVSEPQEFIDGNDTWWESTISLKSSSAEDVYTVAFHRCDVSSMEVGSVSAEIDIVEVNPGPDYLGAGMAPLARIYFVMSCAFFVCALLWGSVLYGNRQSQRLYRVHYLMLALILFKAITLMFRAIDYHYIMLEGTQEEGWAVVYYIAHLAKGIMLFVVIMLIGAGFGFVKHALSKNERLVFLIVIPLQLFSGIAWIVIEETAPGSNLRSMWSSIGLLVDLICCGAILFPVVWSIKHLRESSETDGKVAASLAKLRLFRRFYVMVLGYIYTTRILVYLITNSMPFRYEWLGPFFSEAVTLVFYIVTGAMFSPESDNEYLAVPHGTDDEDSGDEEAGGEPIIIHTGISDGLKHIGKTSKATATPKGYSEKSRRQMMQPDF